MQPKETIVGIEEALKKKRERVEKDRRTNYSLKIYYERKSKGLCCYCGEDNLEEGQIACDDCRDKNNRSRKANQEEGSIDSY